MNQRSYSFDSESRIWRTPAHDSIAYSDGEEVELRLLAALKQCRDLSSTSAELRRHIVDWPSEYHFSALRHVLLRPFAIAPADRILELGCGCGAMTRYLGETGATVTAVEGSPVRAQIAAERCRDLPNVTVYCDNLADFPAESRFDLVTLIGVLEYAPAFIDHAEPAAECLRRARSHLAANGRLLVAIENQLGLKYFAGCAEDHTGVPFFGIEGLYDGRSATTYGRRELTAMLERSGFRHLEWYYPFPDYKLPRIIVSDAAIDAADFDIATLLARTCSRDYRDDPLRSFDEVLARRAVWQNGLLGEMANSFLILASDNTAPARHADFMAKAFNLSRHPRFCTETEFSRDGQGDIRVTRSAILPASLSTKAVERFTHQLPVENHIKGRLLTEQLHELARGDWSIESLTAWAAPWVAEIRRHCGAEDPAQLPPDFVDFTPFNAVRADGGAIAYIDAEWRADRAIPLSWVFIRGLAYSLDNILQPADAAANRKTLIAQIGSRLGIPLTDADFVLAAEWEAALQAQVHGGQGRNVLADILECRAGGAQPILDVLGNARAELARTFDSRSWRLTKPLRRFIGLLQKTKRLGPGNR